MRRTKIVCTIGPATRSASSLAGLLKSGMNIARLNFSHGTPDEHLEVMNHLRAAEAEAGCPVGILQDLPGPKIRIGTVRNEPLVLKEGQDVTLVNAASAPGDTAVIPLPYPKLLKSLQPGNDVFLADGLMHLKITAREGSLVKAKVLHGGQLTSHKGVNLPDIDINLRGALAKDLELFRFGLQHEVDWVAVSFVGSARDAAPFRKVAKELGSSVRLLAKVERRQALANIDEILDAFDGVLVARGDLGIETPISEVPVVQKQLVQRCNAAGKPVVVATQMLMSMVSSRTPTRAEATDVANAIMDGADAVMLSEETAIGQYANRTVAIMDQIAHSAEAYQESLHPESEVLRPSVSGATESIAANAAQLARDLSVKAIITCSSSGATARAVSKFRPCSPILAAVPNLSACRQLNLSWGVRPYSVPEATDIDTLIQNAVDRACQLRLVKEKDWVVIIAGVRAGVPGNTSLVKYHRIGDSIWG